MVLRIKKTELLMCIMLLLPDHFFYLIDTDAFESIFKISYSDFCIVCYIAFFVYMLCKHKMSALSKRYQFKTEIIFILPLTLMAAIVPNILFGQSIPSGWMAQRIFIILILAYYSFRTAIINGDITWDRLLSIMYCIGMITIVLCIIQYLVHNSFQFMYLTYRVRLGQLRMRCNFAYPIIVFIYSMNNLIKNKKIIKSLISLALTMFFYSEISQTRLLIVGCAAAAIVIVFLSRGKISTKMFLMIAGIAVVIGFLNTDLGRYLISAITDVDTDASATIRVSGREWYLSALQAHPIFGQGFPHESCYAAYKAAGNYDNIYLNDNGIIGFAYIYGLVGIVWYVILHIKLIIRAFIAKMQGDDFFLPYLAFNFVIAINIINWYYDLTSGIVLMIVISALESYQESYKNSKRITQTT